MLSRALGCAAFLFVAVAGRAGSAERPPNIVMIVSDDQAWTDFGFMGHAEVRTPHLDDLAERAAVFPHGYVPTSLCRASLATLLTGLYAHQHKICCNDPPEGVDRTRMHPFIRTAPTLPRLLAEAGYDSLQTGKFWEGHFSNAGFTEGMTTAGRHGGPGLAIGRQTMQPIYDFARAHRDEPFFVWYAPMMPHTPHNPPERLLGDRWPADVHPKVAKYYAMIEWFDETVGELLAFLDDEQLAEDTLVVFLVDNGWITETGDVRTTRGWFAPKSKLSPYDGGLRTPILLYQPGFTTAGRYDDLVATTDLVPTLLAAAGAPIPANLPGENLLPRAAGGPPLSRDAVFGEVFVHTAVDLDQPLQNLTHSWVRQGDWKLILPADKTEPLELYHLAADPFEKNNRASDEPAIAAQLVERIAAWRAE